MTGSVAGGPRATVLDQLPRSLRVALVIACVFAITAYFTADGVFHFRYLLPIAGIGLLFGVIDLITRGSAGFHRDPRLLSYLLEFPVLLGIPMSLGISWLETIKDPGTGYWSRCLTLLVTFVVVGGFIEFCFWLLMKWRAKHTGGSAA